MNFLKRINYRILMTVIIIIAQIVWGLVFFLRILDYAEWISTILFIFSILVVLFLNMKEENASYKIGWIILIMAFPLFGGLFYLLFGNKRPSKFMRLALSREHKKVLPYLKQDVKPVKSLNYNDKRAMGMSDYLYKISDYPLYANTESEYYSLGEEMFESMLKEMEKAKDYIFFEYFIIEEERMWGRMLDLLIRKVQEGVDVRMIYDDVGSLFLLPSDFPTKMENVGIKCLAFNRFRPILSAVMNHRNHRKILVIDGFTGFTGGINIADEYINEKERFGHWKDTGIMLKGKGVWSFVVMFTEMWNAFREDRINIESLKQEENMMDKLSSDGFVQSFSDSPLDNEPLGENIYIEILAQATDYVYIFTPYLIIDNELQTALQLAAKRGVDVRIVTPGIPDKKLVFRITRSNYLPLLKAGVRIYEYTPGFMHAKSFVSDNKLALVGTINMDYRSLYLHFECGTILYNSKTIMDIKKDSIETISLSNEIRIEDTNKGFFTRILDAIIRLFAILF